MQYAFKEIFIEKKKKKEENYKFGWCFSLQIQIT